MISVLYVDDEPALLEIAQLFLEETGEFQVRTATSAKEALGLSQILSYDAIISDYQMPGMDGIAFLKAVRQQGSDVPFILFTGRGREEIVIEAINNGADFYLQKGGAPEAQFAELAHKIRQAVRRKQAECSLQDSERRFSDIIEFLPDATFAIDRSGHVIAWNRATEEMTGVPAGEMLGKGDYAYAVPFYGEQRPMLMDLIDKTDEKILEYYTNVYRSETSLTAETDHIHMKGHQIIVLAKACYLYNQAGEITGAVESIRDVTGQKRLEADLEREHGELQVSYEQLAAAEEELREQYDELAGSEQQIRINEERLAMAQELGHTGSWDFNPATNEIWGSSEGLRIFGFHRGAGYFPIADIEACIPERERVNRALVDLLEKGQEYNIEYAISPADGSARRIIHSFARRELDSGGKPIRVIGVIHDITERKQQEEERAFHNAILSTQQETSLDAILIVDENGKIINLNRQFIALWRVPKDLVAGGVDEPVLQFVTGQLADPDAFLTRVKYLYEHKDEKSFEELLLQDGRVVERFSAPMLGETGKYYGRVWYFRDITGRKRTEGALRESEERLRLLIGHAPAALAMFDRDMRYLVASHRWVADYNLAGREIIGHSHYEIFPEISEDLKAVHRRSLAGEVLSAKEDKFEREDGSVQWVSWEVRPWYTDGAAVGGIIIFSEDITDRKRADQALRASEEKYRTLVETAEEGIWAVDENFITTFTNRKMQEIFGYTGEEMLGRPVWDFVFPEDVPGIRQLHQERKAGRSGRYERRWRRKDGTMLWCLTSGAPLVSREGKFFGSFGLFTDITGQKEMADSLRESESRFATVFRNSPVALTLVSAADGKFTDVNDAFTRGSGYSREDAIGKTAAELGLFANRDQAEQMAAALRNHGTAQGLEMKCRAKNGTIQTCRFSAALITMGGSSYILASIEDVTGQKAAEEEIRRSEEKYRFLTENSIDIIYSMDLEGTITHISPQVARYGYTPDQLIGHNIAEVIAEEDLPRIREDIRTTVATERSTRTVFRLKDRPEKPVWLEDNGAVIKKADGIAVGISGVLRDVSERMKAEEALEKSEAWLYRLAEHSPDMIYRMSLPDGRYEYIGPASEAMTGYTPEEFYADSGLIRKLIHPAWQEYFRKEWQALLENRAPPFYEFQIIDRAGNTRWLNQRNVLVTDGTGKPVGIEGIVTDITGQKTTERELRRSELRSLAVSENAGEWIWEVDAEGIYRYSSPAVSKILGYRPEELVGKMHYYDLFDPSVREELKAVTLAGFGSHEPFRDFVNLNRHRNGTPVILRTSATPVFDETGAFTGYCGVDEDITENQRAQEELRESRQMLAAAMDLAHLVNWEYDVDMDTFTFDDRFYALYGTSVEREGGTRMSSETYAREFVHPDDRWMVADEVRKARETAGPGAESHVEHRIVRRDGGIRTISVRIAFTKDEKGRTVKTHGANQDITERKRDEEILRENEEKYRSLVETSPDIIWEIDPQGIFRYVSPMIRTFMGYDPEELIGKPITDLMPEQDRPAGQEYLSGMMTTDGLIPPFEVPGRHRDGRKMAIEIRPARVVDPTGRVTGFRGVARDVTESKRAGDAIRMANRKLHLLSGITRHDISNQLMSLNGFIALVRKKTTDPSLENHFSRIREATDQIMSMIAFTREYEKIGVHAPVWNELRGVVDSAVKGILPVQIALKNEIPPGTGLYADPLVVKVFFNLLDNSVRHGQSVTEIRVSCHQSGNDLVVVWEDNGIGIPVEEKDRIFDKGFGKHTGLGMFLGREILSLTGITITETGVPGTGARFEMVVPKGAYRTASEH